MKFWALPNGRTEMRSKWCAIALASWWGCGLVPAVPGTFASAVAVVVAYLLVDGFGFGMGWLAALSIVLSVPAIWSIDIACKYFGQEDPPEVVVDEVIGQWLALAVVNSTYWQHWLAAFVLFRLFDIFKPFPIRRLERLPAGYGVVADDFAAGLCVMIILMAWGRFGGM